MTPIRTINKGSNKGEIREDKENFKEVKELINIVFNCNFVEEKSYSFLLLAEIFLKRADKAFQEMESKITWDSTSFFAKYLKGEIQFGIFLTILTILLLAILQHNLKNNLLLGWTIQE